MNFFSTLNFSSSNEDGRTELAALAGPCDRLLCLTGSGTRPLDMLLSDANTVLAIDINPAQNALLQLKIAAIRVLNHDELLQYLGILPADDRAGLHARVAQCLSPDIAAYWSKRIKVILTGIWYAGRWEKVLGLGARGIRLIRGNSIQRLFDAPTVQEQAQIWAADFDDWTWRFSIRLLGRRWIWTKVIGEPGGAFLPPPDAVEEKLAGAFNNAAATFLFQDSDFASLILRGDNRLPSAVPIHLLPENFDLIRDRIDRISVVTGALTDLKAQGITGIDRFSLSDFGSYCDEASYAACWTSIAQAATQGARFCERHFMNPLPLPVSGVKIDDALSAQLTRSDRAIIYEIRAGQIGKTENG